MGLSYAQLEGIWIQAGGDPAKAAVAAAVAMAESGGNPNSHNGNAGTGDDSYGLWQINMLGSMGPERRNRYNLPNNQALFDPVTNARVAVAMSGNGNDWGPWTTFTSGAYRRYLQGGVPPNMTASGAGGSAGNPALTAFNPISPTSWANLIGNVGNYTFFGVTLAFGIVLVVAGLIVLIKNESARSAVGSVASRPVGLARKMVG